MGTYPSPRLLEDRKMNSIHSLKSCVGATVGCAFVVACVPLSWPHLGSFSIFFAACCLAGRFVVGSFTIGGLASVLAVPLILASNPPSLPEFFSGTLYLATGFAVIGGIIGLVGDCADTVAKVVTLALEALARSVQTRKQ